MMFRAIVIAALAGFVSANSYSIGCMTTLMNIGSHPEIATCLSPTLLIPILVGAGNSGDSAVAPIDAWLAGMCASPACSNDALTALVQNITTGCSVEYGLPHVQQTLDFVQKNYRTARKVVCLKDGQTNCVTQTLKNIEALTGTMSFNDDDIVAITKAGQAGFPANIACTNCMKGGFTIINQDLPGTLSDSTKKYATDTCGAAFADGGIPPGLIESAWEPAAANTTSVAPTTTPTAQPVASPPVQKKSSALGRASLSGTFTSMVVSGLLIGAGVVVL